MSILYNCRCEKADIYRRGLLHFCLFLLTIQQVIPSNIKFKYMQECLSISRKSLLKSEKLHETINSCCYFSFHFFFTKPNSCYISYIVPRKYKKEKYILTCSSISVRINPKRIQFGHHLQVFLRQFPLTILRPLFISRSIVFRLLYQFSHFFVCSVLFVLLEVNSGQALVGPRVPDLKRTNVTIGRLVQLPTININAAKVVQGLRVKFTTKKLQSSTQFSCLYIL